jgi:hypothetical protein
MYVRNVLFLQSKFAPKYLLSFNELGARTDQLIEGWSKSWMAAVQFPLGARYPFLFHNLQIALEPTQSAMQWAWENFPGLKQQRDQAEHQPQSGAEVRKGRAVTTLTYTSSWRVAYLLKHRESFTFCLENCSILHPNCFTTTRPWFPQVVKVLF